MTEDIQLYETFFQKSKSYYVDKWTNFNAGQKISFNAFAFLFGLFWFMYRKMYIEALIVLIAVIVENFLATAILPNDIGQDTMTLVNIISTVAIATILGFLGNYFYIRKADKIVEKAKTTFSDDSQQKKYLHRKGGVSYFFLIAIAILIILFFVYNNYITPEIN